MRKNLSKINKKMEDKHYDCFGIVRIRKGKNILNYNIEVQHSDDGGYYEETRSVYSEEITKNDEEEIII